MGFVVPGLVISGLITILAVLEAIVPLVVILCRTSPGPLRGPGGLYPWVFGAPFKEPLGAIQEVHIG